MADKKKTLSFYFKIWKKYTLLSFNTELTSRFGVLIFLLAKLFRFIFFLFFLILLFRRNTSLGVFNFDQMAFFFLVFNFIDSFTQFLYREVYRFRMVLIRGQFDYILISPVNSLFRLLFGGADILDLVMLIPIVLALVYFGMRLPSVFLGDIFIFFLLLVNSLVLVTAFHILVLAVGILTTTVDHTIMIYRDISSMGRVPVDIYKEPLRSLLTFVVPVGIMVTFPAKSIMGLLSFSGATISLVVGMLFFCLSLKIWRYALTKYSSASS